MQPITAPQRCAACGVAIDDDAESVIVEFNPLPGRPRVGWHHPECSSQDIECHRLSRLCENDPDLHAVEILRCLLRVADRREAAVLCDHPEALRSYLDVLQGPQQTRPRPDLNPPDELARRRSAQ